MSNIQAVLIIDIKDNDFCLLTIYYIVWTLFNEVIDKFKKEILTCV